MPKLDAEDQMKQKEQGKTTVVLDALTVFCITGSV